MNALFYFSQHTGFALLIKLSLSQPIAFLTFTHFSFYSLLTLSHLTGMGKLSKQLWYWVAYGGKPQKTTETMTTAALSRNNTMNGLKNNDFFLRIY